MRPPRLGRLLAGVLVTSAAALVAVSGAAVATAVPPHGPAAVDEGDDANQRARLAEAQFVLHLLTATDLVPTQVTCAPPPVQDLESDLVCFALVDGRRTVAAVARLVGPDAYAFTALSKLGAGPPAPGPPDAPADGLSPLDTTAVEFVESATDDADGLESYLVSQEPAITSVVSMSFDPAVSTVQVEVTTTAPDEVTRHRLAYFVTDTMAYLWEAGRALREEGVTIQPRLEVIVDGVIYGAPYDVMVGVADYTILFDEWLAVTTGANAFRLVARPFGEDLDRMSDRRYQMRPAAWSRGLLA
jgi:hypothetical protein